MRIYIDPQRDRYDLHLQLQVDVTAPPPYYDYYVTGTFDGWDVRCQDCFRFIPGPTFTGGVHRSERHVDCSNNRCGIGHPNCVTHDGAAYDESIKPTNPIVQPDSATRSSQ